MNWTYLASFTHYDRDGRVTGTVDANGGLTQKQYDGDGNLIAFTDPDKNTTRYQYDSDNLSLPIIASGQWWVAYPIPVPWAKPDLAVIHSGENVGEDCWTPQNTATLSQNNTARRP